MSLGFRASRIWRPARCACGVSEGAGRRGRSWPPMPATGTSCEDLSTTSSKMAGRCTSQGIPRPPGRSSQGIPYRGGPGGVRSPPRAAASARDQLHGRRLSAGAQQEDPGKRRAPSPGNGGARTAPVGWCGVPDSARAGLHGFRDGSLSRGAGRRSGSRPERVPGGVRTGVCDRRGPGARRSVEQPSPTQRLCRSHTGRRRVRESASPALGDRVLPPRVRGGGAPGGYGHCEFQAQSDFALACERLGTSLAQTGGAPEGLRLLDRSLGILKPILAADQGNLGTRARVANTRIGLGFAHAALGADSTFSTDTRAGHWREARAGFQDGLVFWAEMRDTGFAPGAEGDNPDRLAREIAKCDAALTHRR